MFNTNTTTTKRDFYIALAAYLNGEELATDVEATVEFINGEIEALDRKKEQAKVYAAKKKTANKELAQKVLAFMQENRTTVYTAAKLQEDCADLAPCSIQKVSAVLRSLVEAGDISKENIKGKNFYSAGSIQV